MIQFSLQPFALQAILRGEPGTPQAISYAVPQTLTVVQRQQAINNMGLGPRLLPVGGTIGQIVALGSAGPVWIDLPPPGGTLSITPASGSISGNVQTPIDTLLAVIAGGIPNGVTGTAPPASTSSSAARTFACRGRLRQPRRRQTTRPRFA